MSVFLRRSAVAQAVIWPRCRQPWFQRRALAGSPRLEEQHLKTEGFSHREDTTDEGSAHKGVGPTPSGPSGSLSGLRGLRQKIKPTAEGASSKSRIILGQSADLPIRARFAPSPTGDLHLGSLRTALFNKLAASASNGGAFILRVEDTDQSRLVPGAEKRMFEDLEWAGLSWDEGPDRGGPYGPYRQSERLDTYKEHIHQLLDHGHAYRCFCSPEKLDEMAQSQREAGHPTHYPGTCRDIPRSASDRRADEGESYAVRFKTDASSRPKFRDAIYGPSQKKTAEEDFILLKRDGFPTYHFANVVDDHLMKITHVIRGEEWLISTSKHIALYEAFGWQPPTFAHLALLVNPDGSKLSKRHASANVAEYRGKIFPMALLAWLANLGSSFVSKAPPPRTIRDIVNALTFRFTKGGVRLNPEKLEYFQGKYRDALFWKPVDDLAETEATLIDQYMTQPLLRDILSMTNGTNPEGPSSTWQHPLEPTPTMASDDETRTNYLRRVLTSKPGDFPSSTTLIHKHPYLFWRVPPSLYKASLATFAPNQKVLEAMEEATAVEELWVGDGDILMKAIGSNLSAGDLDALHDTLRFIAVGTESVDSMTSKRMLTLLGREELKHRLDAVRQHLQEQEGLN